jgi:hypothetical protein
VPGVVPAVKTPVLESMVPASLWELAIPQINATPVITLPSWSSPCAVNHSVCPDTTEGLTGLTVILVKTAGIVPLSVASSEADATEGNPSAVMKINKTALRDAHILFFIFHFFLVSVYL